MSETPLVVSRVAWYEQTTWIIILFLAGALPLLAIQLGAPNFIASFTAAILVLLPFQIWKEGPSKEEFAEYAYLRIARVKLYFWGLLYLVFANVVLLWVLPLNDIPDNSFRWDWPQSHLRSHATRHEG